MRLLFWWGSCCPFTWLRCRLGRVGCGFGEFFFGASVVLIDADEVVGVFDRL